MINGSVGKAYLTLIPKLDPAAKESISKEIGGIGDDAGGFAGKAFNGKFGAIAKKLPGALKALGIGAAVGKFIGDSISVGMDFDQSMSQIAATMGKSVEDIGDLRKFALEMGSTTAFSASQAAEGLNYMALAGYTSEQSMEMLPTVLNLAAAGSMELAAASDMVTDAQSALGLSTEETTTMVDQMAKTASTTNTSVAQLGEAFLTVGGTAKSLAGGTAELSQVLGILADNGIKGAEGGTALRNIMTSFSNGKFDETFKKFGISAYDASGNLRDMQDIMLDLNDAMSGMSTQERDALITEAFNARDLKSINALLGTSADRWDEVAGAIANADDAAEKMAGTQLDNLAGDVTLMKSAFEGLQIQISDSVSPMLRSLVQGATGAIGGITGFLGDSGDVFTSLSEALDGILPIIGGIVKVIAPIAGGILKGIGDTLSTVIGFMMELGAEIKGELAPLFPQLETGGLTISDIIGGIANVISTVLVPILEFFISIIGAVIRAVGTIVGVAVSAIMEIVAWFQSLPENIANLPERMKEIGRNIIEGIKQGIREKVDTIFEGLKSAISNGIKWIKNLLGIASPSKVFAEIGANTILGYKEGIKSATPAALRAMEDATASVAAAGTVGMSINGGLNGQGRALAGNVIYINGARVNDTPGIQNVLVDFLLDLKRLGVMEGAVA